MFGSYFWMWQLHHNSCVSHRRNKILQQSHFLSWFSLVKQSLTAYTLNQKVYYYINTVYSIFSSFAVIIRKDLYINLLNHPSQHKTYHNTLDQKLLQYHWQYLRRLRSSALAEWPFNALSVDILSTVSLLCNKHTYLMQASHASVKVTCQQPHFIQLQFVNCHRWYI